MKGGMTFDATFQLGGDPEAEARLKAAQELAQQLSGVTCPWHGKSAEVLVQPGESRGDLVWAINGACCDSFKAELAKLIEKTGG